MTLVSSPVTEAERIASRLELCRQALITIDRRPSSIQEWDVRRCGPRNSSDVILGAQMQLHILHLVQSGAASPQSLLGVEGDIDTAIRILARSARIALCLEYQFQIENMLKNLATALGISRPSRQFELLAQQVITQTEIVSFKRRAARLYALSLVRNTLHNNGIHGGRDRQIKINSSLTLTFRKGRRFTQAGWEDILGCLEESVTLIGELLGARSIQQLESVDDPYGRVIASDGA